MDFIVKSVMRQRQQAKKLWKTFLFRQRRKYIAYLSDFNWFFFIKISDYFSKWTISKFIFTWKFIPSSSLFEEINYFLFRFSTNSIKQIVSLWETSWRFGARTNRCNLLYHTLPEGKSRTEDADGYMGVAVVRKRAGGGGGGGGLMGVGWMG